jgi:feruloyl esterase
MRTSESRRYKPELLASALALGAVAAGALLLAVPTALAATACNAGAVSGLNVPDVTVVSATDVPAAGINPELCAVLGVVATHGHGAPDGSANFQLLLPINWNHKLLYLGNGGFAGSLSPAVSPTDGFQALPKGYALAISDTGHEAGTTDASWALELDGTPDEAKLTDYFFRATHQVTVATKELTERFFAQGDIRRAYFDGCSNGGRMALMEASRFPDDFDGIIAGDPFMSIRATASGAHFAKQQLTTGNFIPFTLLPVIDQATLAACDAADGVKDGLIQNPGACSFKPETLLCQPHQNPATCLSTGQVDTLKAYFSAAPDDDGRVVYPGAAISDLGGTDGAALWTTGFFLNGQALPAGDTQATFDVTAPEPWGNAGFSPAPAGWQFADHAIKYIVERDPNFNLRNFTGPGAIGDAALALFDQRTDAGDADVADGFDRFIDKNRKLLIYHGFSDPALTAFRSIMLYEDLAKRADGGFEELQENVRLFLVPGMHHCVGGPGPNTFDTLTALENWVEHGIGPDTIIATKFTNDNPANAVSRTMPLCKFPEQAHFLGNPNIAMAKDINDATHWACSPHDQSLLQVGLNGRQAGLGTPQAAEGNDDRRDRDDGRDRDDDHDHGSD